MKTLKIILLSLIPGAIVLAIFYFTGTPLFKPHPRCVYYPEEKACLLLIDAYIQNPRKKERDAKQKLKDLIEKGVSEKQYAIVYTKDIVHLEEAEKHINEYDLQYGNDFSIKKESISFIVGEDDYSATSWRYPFKASEIKKDLESNYQSEAKKRFKKPVLLSIVVWGTPKKLLQLWEENKEIGLICSADKIIGEPGPTQLLDCG